jgi:hypothetical protein
MERIITMSTNELDRPEVFFQLRKKIIIQSQAAELLGLSTRQIRRLFKEYKKIGPLALISKKWGKPGNHQLPEWVKDMVLSLIQAHYADFGPTLAHEKLTEIHKIQISLWSVRKIMLANDLWKEKKVKKQRIFQLRERREMEGELIQIDGSPHDWFEKRGPKCSLLHCIDDATGKIMAAFFAPSEAIWPYFDLMKIYLKKHGRPLALYNDKHGVFRVNRSEALSGEGITQFCRAMQELGITLIYANSPQAKGRIERSNRTLQDRLTKELRLNKISTIEEANAFLSTFIEDYNRRFAVVPKSSNNAHRPLLQEQNLEVVFTIREFRHLSKNLSFQYKGTIYQIQTEKEEYVLRKAKVEIREGKDGSITVFYKKKEIPFTIYNQQQKQSEVVDSKRLNEVLDNLQNNLNQRCENRPWKPRFNHPWKRGARRKLFGKVPAF